MAENSKSEFLTIKSKTWTRDSHGLFDYESSVVKENMLLIKSPTKLIRKKHEIREKKEIEINEAEDQLMCNVMYQTRKYILSTNLEKGMSPTENNINELQNKIWYIIKAETNHTNTNQNPNIVNENESFVLKLNDIMKLGRIKYVITDLCMNNKLSSIEDQNSGAVFNLILDYNQSIQDPETTCKYCLQHECYEGTPLLRLCVCAESMSVHYGCVKKWISIKLSQKKNDKETVFSYNMKSFNCDICKTPYPLRFRHDGVTQNLIDLNRPKNKNYLILESLNQVKDGNNYKSIHVITLEKNSRIVMGRGHEADVRINDISVSRMHGSINLDDNNIILLRDLGSKFGTLALIQENFVCGPKKVCLQIGRSYMEVISQPISEYLVVQQQQKEFEKLTANKEKQRHHQQQQHKEYIPDIDNFDLAGIKELIDANEISQADLYHLIRKGPFNQDGNLGNPIGITNLNLLYGNNPNPNYFTNPNNMNGMQMNIQSGSFMQILEREKSKRNRQNNQQNSSGNPNNVGGNIGQNPFINNLSNMNNVIGFNLNNVVNPVPYSSNYPPSQMPGHNHPLINLGGNNINPHITNMNNGNNNNTGHNTQKKEDKKTSNTNVNNNGQNPNNGRRKN